MGGTGFVGRAVAEAAVARGWAVDAFHRGRHAPPPGVTSLRGDRTGEGPHAPTAGEWDLVVDTWSGAPTAVRDAARALAGRAGHYTYVSSRSVYTWPIAAGLDEGGPVVAGSPDAGATDYPADKRGGELAAEAAFPGRALLVRCGLLLGPYEDVGRLPWWLTRIARGGPVLAPGPRDLPLQYVDVRDLARWTLDAAARGLAGPHDLVSPPGHTTMGGLLDACVLATGSDADLRWTAPDAVLAAGIAPWTELPVWTPPGELHDALHRSDPRRALATGLRCRPVGETVADTWAWLRGLDDAARRALARPSLGVTPEAEAAVLGGEGTAAVETTEG